MKKCPYCGHENKDNGERCERCSAGLPQKKETEENIVNDSEHEEIHAFRKRVRS